METLFVHLNRILKLDRLRLRGLIKAHDEFLLFDVLGAYSPLDLIAKAAGARSMKAE